FSGIFSHLGLGPALVQRKELELRHLEAGFSFSILLGIAVGAVIWLIAPLAATFFDIPEVRPVLRALAWVFPLRGLGTVAESLLARELRFSRMANIEVASFALGYGGTGIIMALNGFGVWALVGAQVAQSVVKVGLLLASHPEPRRLGMQREAVRDLLYFGSGFTVGRVANHLAHNLDNLVVGRWLGAAALGFYSRAYQLMAMPAQLFGQALDVVVFPGMSRIQDESKRLGIAYRRGTASIALVMLPASALFFVLAPEIVLVLLGPGWDAVVGPFRIFAIAMYLRNGYKMADSLARARGAVYRRAWRQALHALLVFLGAWIGQRWGISGVAWGVSLALAANFVLMAHLSARLSGVTARAIIGAHRAALTTAAAVLAVAWGLADLTRTAGLPSVAVLLITTAGCGLLVLVAIRSVPTAVLGADGIWLLDRLRDAVHPHGRPVPEGGGRVDAA
ncbi:MAG: oligosaccharide flippase family protein, partial [Gemmatimonadetes bacterium]|nr:lipopolysaccharide biosynthesis protein [Gemmatimonadota bacterium]NIQ54272.1 lipopolysaccharide biosynthesis protein [Gemmatimonadota bacterium]NIU74483.1 oligosaccharide flippase family protein [Gammaproteobacteria bacterium]NIX44446.1 oligosaccharide flippase family protein [Gemmatimonadota bacterium]NIY08671.1 oligosaccharide flippase family protein [Gemmatimonadota bacterium]